MEEREIKLSTECQNCGAKITGNYCANCGQRVLPTKLSVVRVLGEVFETVFNFDNRLFKSLNELFFKPGQMTRKFNHGKRQRYLSPIRLYLSISLVYFVLVQFIPADQIFFVSLTEGESLVGDYDKAIQYMLFLLVPVMAFWAKLIHRSRKKRYMVEYLVFALHIHSIWFVLLSFDLLAEVFFNLASEKGVSAFNYLAYAVDAITQIAVFVYPILYFKHAFHNQKWWQAVLKAFGLMVLYFASLGAAVALYLFIFTKIS